MSSKFMDRAVPKRQPYPNILNFIYTTMYSKNYTVYIEKTYLFRKEIIVEIKVNREIRNYNEAIFLGLSMRQLIFSALAIGVAIGVYFLLRDVMPLETRSWVCILCAAPFGALGFVSYNGMTAEKLLIAVIKYLITPKVLVYQPENEFESMTEEAKRH